MAYKHVNFFERTFVKKLCYALAGGVLAACMLFLYGFFAASEASLIAEGNEFLYFFKLIAHYLWDSMFYIFGGFKSLVGVLAEFYESAAGRFRVKESDVEAFGTFAGSLVNQASAL